MLPSGHFAAGYLVSSSALSVLERWYPIANEPKYLIIGLVASVIVDLDEFIAFAKIGGWIGGDGKISHRKFISHAPLLHVAASVLAFASGIALHNQPLQLGALMYCIGVLSHFLLDSFAYGIMWLWPFTSRIYAFRLREKELGITTRKFWSYWTEFLRIYVRDPLSWAEAIITVAAIIVFFLRF